MPIPYNTTDLKTKTWCDVHFHIATKSMFNTKEAHSSLAKKSSQVSSIAARHPDENDLEYQVINWKFKSDHALMPYFHALYPTDLYRILRLLETVTTSTKSQRPSVTNRLDTQMKFTPHVKNYSTKTGFVRIEMKNSKT